MTSPILALALSSQARDSATTTDLGTQGAPSQEEATTVRTQPHILMKTRRSQKPAHCTAYVRGKWLQAYGIGMTMMLRFSNVEVPAVVRYLAVKVWLPAVRPVRKKVALA